MTVRINSGSAGVFDSEDRLIDGCFDLSPEARERAMETTRKKLDRIEAKLDRLLASVDTLPKGEDRADGLRAEQG